MLAAATYARGLSESDKGFLQGAAGMHLLPYVYRGAKHMVTGYDYLLFLCGVIFSLYRGRIGACLTVDCASVHQFPSWISAGLGHPVVRDREPSLEAPPALATKACGDVASRS